MKKDKENLDPAVVAPWIKAIIAFLSAFLGAIGGSVIG